MTLAVSEIFGPTIQGEGAQIGRPTVFVRLGACDYRCSWCDTPHAVLPEHARSWTKTDELVILGRVAELTNDRPILITLSGGNPALQDCSRLLEAGHEVGFTFTMETQGSKARPWFAQLDHLCLSPKPPSSKMPTDLGILEQCVALGPRDTILKVVVFDRTDYAYAKAISGVFPELPVYLQVGNWNPTGDVSIDHRLALLDSLQDLAERVTTDGWYSARVLPQLHTLMWGNARGV